MAEVAEINPRIASELTDGSSRLVSFVPMGAVSEVSALVIAPEEREAGQCLKGYTPFVRGDGLVAKITPCFENGKIALASIPHQFGFGSTEFHVVRADVTRLDSRFLLHMLRHPEFRLKGQRRMTGSAGQRRVPEHFLSTFAIPLPSLVEQRRIAAILDKADALRVKRRAALAKLDTLTQSIFLDMFGDPAMNSKRWQRIALIDLCSQRDDIKCGPFGTQLSQSEYITQGVPLWGIKQVNAFFRLPTHEFLDQRTAKRLNQYSIEADDIVMTRKGTVGNCAVYPTDLPPGIMHSDLLRLRVSRERSEPVFIAHQLHYSRDVERQLVLISGGAIMPGINVTKLKTLTVVVPPLSSQCDFVRRAAAVDRTKALHDTASEKLDQLFASLQHRAFRGEL